MTVTLTEPAAPARPAPSKHDIYTRAADLLEEYGWTQDEEARDHTGEPTWCISSEATSFCLWGALQRACWDLSPDDHGFDAYDQLVNNHTQNRIHTSKWNDRIWRQPEHVITHLRQLAQQAR